MMIVVAWQWERIRVKPIWQVHFLRHRESRRSETARHFSVDRWRFRGSLDAWFILDCGELRTLVEMQGHPYEDSRQGNRAI